MGKGDGMNEEMNTTHSNVTPKKHMIKKSQSTYTDKWEKADRPLCVQGQSDWPSEFQVT